MKKITYYITVLAVTGGIFLTGCTGSFDEINTDPDRPTPDQVPNTNVLAFCERYASSALFDSWFDLNESCGFAGQVAKMQYTEEGYYNFRPNVNNNSWYYCYRLLGNLQGIIDKATVGEEVNMAAAADIFYCQIMQITTDRWGDVPYTEALKYDQGIKTPAYDTQESIYTDLLKRLKADADAIGTGSDKLGDGDVMLSGDLAAWKKYCNSLRLRIAVRASKKSPELAKATIEEILGNPNKYPLVATNDDNIFFQKVWGQEYKEPWSEYYATRKQEYCVSKTLIDKLKELDDPRLAVYALPTDAWTAWEKDKTGAEPVKYNGYQNGTKLYATTNACSKIGDRFMFKGSVGTGFTPYLRSCETFFNIAIAAKEGFNTGTYGDAEANYKKAVVLSLEENGVSASDAEAYVTTGGGKYDGTDAQLYTQFWISLFKQGMEAWSVYRFSGYPTENVVAPDNYYDSTHSKYHVPPLVYPYPDTEANLNAANESKADEGTKDYFWGRQMWWDTRTIQYN